MLTQVLKKKKRGSPFILVSTFRSSFTSPLEDSVLALSDPFYFSALLNPIIAFRFLIARHVLSARVCARSIPERSIGVSCVLLWWFICLAEGIRWVN